MIRYRYNLETDPEPGPHVRRLRAWYEGDAARYSLRWAYRWVRQPCRLKSGHTHRTEMAPSDRRAARRAGVFYVGRSGRRQHLPATRWGRTRWSCKAATGGTGHYHWTDGDKFRAWGPLRGCNRASDADAFRRLRTETRRRTKHRGRRR